MDRMRTLGLLDSNEKPLAERVQRALTTLLPKVRRQFPSLRDDLALTEVVEEAGRRIASREERGGPIEQLHQHATWQVFQRQQVAQSSRGIDLGIAHGTLLMRNPVG